MASPKLRFKEFDGDWSSVCLLEISSLVTKGTTPKQFVNGDINFLKIEAITENGFDLSKCQTINSEIHNKELKRSVLKEGDILFAIAGATIGKNAIVQKKFLPANTNQALAIVRLKEEYSNVFVSKVLNSPLMEKYIDSNISTGAQPNLNLKQIGDFSFDLPKIKEQTKIASFLSAVDEKINLLTQKYELLSQYKQGMMQKLFSLQMRFKADDGSEFGEWENNKIIEVADYVDYRGKTPKKVDEGILLVTAKNIRSGYIDYQVSREYICLDDFEEVMRRGQAKIGDVLITTEAPLGNVASVDREDIALAQRVIKYRGKEGILNNAFLKQKFLSEDFQLLIASKATGGTVKGIKGSTLHNLEIYMPINIKEQTKIANFLTSIDIVPQELEDYKSKYKDLYDRINKGTAVEKDSVLRDVNFALDFIISDYVNQDYIYTLLNMIAAAPPSSIQRAKQQQQLQSLLSNDRKMYKKMDLIQKFIDEQMPRMLNGQSVQDAFKQFWDAEKQQAYDVFCKDENLVIDEFKKVVQRFDFTECFPHAHEIRPLPKTKPSALVSKVYFEGLHQKTNAILGKYDLRI